MLITLAKIVPWVEHAAVGCARAANLRARARAWHCPMASMTSGCSVAFWALDANGLGCLIAGSRKYRAHLAGV